MVDATFGQVGAKGSMGTRKSLQPARIITCAHPTLCEANMFTIKPSVKFLGALSVLAASIFSFSGPAAAAPLPAGWTCTANCGTMGANGDVTASPQGGDYGYVSTDLGVG